MSVRDASSVGNPVHGRRGRHLALGALAWLGLAVLFAGQLVTYGDWSFRTACEIAALTVMPAGVLSPLVWWSARRPPWSRLPSASSIVAHALTACVFSVLLVSLEIGLATAIGAMEARRFIVSSMGLTALMGTTIYGLVAGASLAFQSQARMSAQAAELNSQVARAAQADAALASAELALLKARLNPHFLFNGLHCISALVRTNPAEADEAIDELGRLLRIVMSAGNEDTTLDEEVRLAQTYVAFERRRLRNPLNLIVQVEDATLDTCVPRLLLQPLMENAVRHGIEPQDHEATISIRASLDADSLVITVSDSGAGASGVDWAGRGNGLVGLRRRLSATHGPQARVDVATHPGAGFAVTIRLPAS